MKMLKNAVILLCLGIVGVHAIAEELDKYVSAYLHEKKSEFDQRKRDLLSMIYRSLLAIVPESAHIADTVNTTFVRSAFAEFAGQNQHNSSAMLIEYGPTMYGKNDFFQLNELLEKVHGDTDKRIFLLSRRDRGDIILILKRREQKIISELTWCDQATLGQFEQDLDSGSISLSIVSGILIGITSIGCQLWLNQ